MASCLDISPPTIGFHLPIGITNGVTMTMALVAIATTTLVLAASLFRAASPATQHPEKSPVDATELDEECGRGLIFGLPQ
jgi:hypothetical protein